jgi:hypothetical protein
MHIREKPIGFLNSKMKRFFLPALLACLVWSCSHDQAKDPKAEEQCATCAAHLRMIDNAKQRWADKNGKTTSDTPKIDDLNIYFRGIPACPSGGTYTLAPVGALSTCSIPEHTAYYEKTAAAK